MKLKKLLTILNRIVLRTKINNTNFEKLKSLNKIKNDKFNYDIAIDSKNYNTKEKVEMRMLAILINSGLVKNFNFKDYKNSKYDNIINYLIDNGYINEIQGKNIIKFYLNEYKLGLNLLNLSYISNSQLEEALSMQEKTGKTIGEILVRNGSITEELLTDAIVQRTKLYL
jgi:hypothetical protein